MKLAPRHRYRYRLCLDGQPVAPWRIERERAEKDAIAAGVAEPSEFDDALAIKLPAHIQMEEV